MSGIFLRRIGANESMVRFWLQYGRELEQVHLGRLAKMLVYVCKTDLQLFEEKRVGVKSQMYFVLVDLVTITVYPFLTV